MATVYGDKDELHLTTGMDIRYVDQKLVEDLTTNVLGPVEDNQPRSFMTDPGVFAEIAMPFESYFTTKVVRPFRLAEHTGSGQRSAAHRTFAAVCG